MNAHEVIDAYVTDVAVQLPRRQRNDVAFELRALLTEELQGKAEATGRHADAEMAIAFLNAFGRPEDVAARYRPTLSVIDPADGYAFLRATIIGLTIIWSLGLLQLLGQPIDSGSDLLRALGHWWTGTVIASLWWPGVLVVGFGLAAWSRRRWPQSAAWQPRAADRIHGGRATMVLALIGILCGLFVLLDPRWVLDVIWGGRAAPAAYQALTYTETFRNRQAPWLLALLLLNVPIYLTVIVIGRWTAGIRRIETLFAFVTCAALVWTVVDGPVFMAATSDKTVKFFLVLIVAFTLIHFGVQWHRRVKPAPG